MDCIKQSIKRVLNKVEFLACGDDESKDNIVTKYDLASVNAKIRGAR